MHPQNCLTAPHIRQADIDLPVEPTGAQQRAVEDIRSVGGGDDDHAVVGGKAIHLDQQLVEGLLPLVVAAAQAGAALATDRVDLIDKDNTGRVFLCFVKQIPHTGGANTDIHLDEIRT